MIDPRITKLADTLVNYSCAVKPGEKILIEAIDVPHEFTAECVRLAREAGGSPLVTLKSNQVQRALLLAGSEEQWQLVADVEKHRMENVQCYIGARGNPNIAELSDVPGEKQKIYESTVQQSRKSATLEARNAMAPTCSCRMRIAGWPCSWPGASWTDSSYSSAMAVGHSQRPNTTP